MAVYKNSIPFGSIVTDGLILNLDATNINSYPGSGTTWTDLSGRGNNNTLTNGPTFLRERGRGSIVFDGVDDFTAPPSNTFNYSPGTTGEISLEIWVYPTGPYTSYVAEPPTTNLGGFLGQGYFGNSTGWGLGMYTVSGNNYWQFQIRNLGTAIGFSPISDLIFTNNSWYHVVGTFTRNDFFRIYINGQLKQSNSSVALNGISINPSTFNAAISKIGGFISGCRMSVARIYTRPLSAQEVQQNFNALKSRFSL